VVGKVFVALDEMEQLTVERICLDRDPDDALEFLAKCILPRLHKANPCVDKALALYGPWKEGI